jgi:type VI secretion system secreted protein VgrG
MEATMPWLNLLFKDSTGVALAAKPFKLIVEGQDPVVGTTDEQGRLCTEVAAGAQKATLFFRHRRFELELDALPEVAEVAGVQERLNLLNYFSGRVDGDLGPRTRNALKSFQRQHALDETGECDAATLRSLKKAFGA